MRELQMSQKRTCNGCVALNMIEPWWAKCDLGYEIDQDTFVPLEPCPKPLTMKDLMRCGNKDRGEELIKDINIESLYK